MNVVQVFPSHLFIPFEHGRFCVVFVSLVSVEDFVESCCFWPLVVLIPILCFFCGVNGREYILEM